MAEQQQRQPNTVLARCTMVLRDNGEVEILISNIEPEEFLRVAKETNPAWADAELIAKGIGFVTNKFLELDKQLDEYIERLV